MQLFICCTNESRQVPPPPPPPPLDLCPRFPLSVLRGSNWMNISNWIKSISRFFLCTNRFQRFMRQFSHFHQSEWRSWLLTQFIKEKERETQMKVHNPTAAIFLIHYFHSSPPLKFLCGNCTKSSQVDSTMYYTLTPMCAPMINLSILQQLKPIAKSSAFLC